MTRVSLLPVLAASPGLAQAPAPATLGMQLGTMPDMPAAPGMAQGTPMQTNDMEAMRQIEVMNTSIMGALVTDNPDQGVVAMMTPRYQDKKDVALDHLRKGKKPEIRQMAEMIIAD